jgi:uncharacterized protein YndB with AHSA1/START domain
MTGLRIAQIMPATPERVWHAMTDSAALAAWFLAGAFRRDRSLVTIALSPVDGGTALVLIHGRLADEATRDNHRTAWSDCLDRLPSWAQLAAQGGRDQGV